MTAMRYADMDEDMRELFGALSKAIVPRKRRPAAVRTNWHTPYYSRSRYRRI